MERHGGVRWRWRRERVGECHAGSSVGEGRVARLWLRIPFILLDGVLNPLSDAALVGDRTARRFVREIEQFAAHTEHASGIREMRLHVG